MKKLGLFLAIVFILSACGPAPTPTPDVNATTQAQVLESVARTLTAQPTNTTVPSSTPAPTETQPPLPTETSTVEPTLALSLTPTLDLTLAAQPSATAWTGMLSPGDIEGLPTGFVLIENNTGVKEITITLTGVTLKREKTIYLAYKVTGSLLLNIPHARYDYVIQIPNKRILTGSFTQASKDKTTLRVQATRVIIVGP
ncbi:MAG: hypothetical protein WCK35_13710 [Chloroflexota bacterium]